MNRILILSLITIVVMGCERKTNMENSQFKSEKVSKTASFIVDSNIEKVFPLFGAFEERKWAPHWEPILIYPDEEIIEEGTTFKIKNHGHGHDSENEFLWIVTKYDTQSYLVQYLVSTNNRFWTITVKCESMDSDSQTRATVTYSYFGLNSKGNELNKSSLEKMYKHNLQDWADAINTYLSKV